jgi:hypothetical protein
MHEGAALRTPLVLIPGTLLETLVVAQGLNQHADVPVFAVDLGPKHLVAKPREFDQSFKVLGAAALTDAFAAILAGGEAQRERVERAHALVTSARGAEAAAQLVLEVVAWRRRALADGGRQNFFRTTGPGFVVDEGEPPST